MLIYILYSRLDLAIYKLYYKIMRLVFMDCMHACSIQLFCDLLDWSPPGFSVHGISQARILKWVAISSSRGSS